jgi:hypothetical protein
VAATLLLVSAGLVVVALLSAPESNTTGGQPGTEASPVDDAALVPTRRSAPGGTIERQIVSVDDGGRTITSTFSFAIWSPPPSALLENHP